MPRMSDGQLEQAAIIVDAYKSMNEAGIFCVGSFGNYVNFSAQQYRALNLIWALDALERLRRDLPIAVIGGGLTGVTTAVALVQLGYTVELFEGRKELMAHQLTTDHRLVHPTINNWPLKPLVPGTSLPFLNWVSGPCSKVISGILKEVEALRTSRPKDFKIHRSRQIVDISKGMNGYLLETTRKALHTAFSAVILCVGFGDERQHKDFEAVSYWFPDGLEREPLIGDVKNFIVSGCGDGGLIDALRILHRDFDKGGLIFETANSLADEDVAEPIARAEQTARRARTESAVSPKLSDQEFQEIYEAAARKIAGEDRYKSVHQALERSANECRPRVILSARHGENPFSSQAAPIHKLMLAHAMVMNKAIYLKGELIKVGDLVELNAKRYRLSGESRIIVRHGPVGPKFSGLLDDDSIERMRRLQLKSEELISQRVWPEEYEDWVDGPVFERAMRLQRQALRALRLLSPNAIVAVTRDGFQVSTIDDAVPPNLPSELFGIPVSFEKLPKVDML